MSVTKRRKKAILRRQWATWLACKWDFISGRDRGCHVQSRTGIACEFHGGAA